MAKAACRPVNGVPPGAWWDEPDPEVFFPKQGKLDDQDKAKWTCFTCPVKVDCKNYAERAGATDGIWFGENLNNANRERQEQAKHDTQKPISDSRPSRPSLPPPIRR